MIADLKLEKKYQNEYQNGYQNEYQDEYPSEYQDPGTSDHQICVLQTASATGQRIRQAMNLVTDRSLIREIFVPKREIMRRVSGAWTVVQEAFFPDCVFVATTDFEQLLQELREIPGMSAIMAQASANLLELKPIEQQALERIGERRGDHIFRLSRVRIVQDIPYQPGHPVEILSGDLADFRQDIIRYDFHHRKAMIRSELFGGVVLHVGIELVRDIG